MPRDLFGNVTRQSISVGSRKWYTLPLSLISHSAIVLALIAIPILAPAVMPSVFADNALTIIDIQMPKTPPLPPRQELRHDVPQPTGASLAPIVAPTGLGPERPVIEPGWENRIGDSSVQGTFDPSFSAPPPEPKAPPQPVRVGFSGVRTPVKTRHLDPVYPPIAQAARVQGIVILEATISEDGQVTNARILRSVPLLDQAALDAVRQWQFTPTLLNGVPVPVIMTVTVNFTLSR
jgi:periplasmic protein TonB